VGSIGFKFIMSQAIDRRNGNLFQKNAF
jgi:hypothetical protein